jgi:IS1 family transposase
MKNSSILQQPSTKNHGQLLVVVGYYAFRNLRCKRLQLDEMWAWIYCKEKNHTEEIARKQPDAGDVWLWVAVDADSKLVPSWRLGQRDLTTATDFVNDLARRVKGRVQITTDALRTYVNVIEDAFGTEADYAQLHKVYRAPMENETRYSPARCIGCSTKDVSGNPDPKHISTSFFSLLTFVFKRGLFPPPELPRFSVLQAVSSITFRPPSPNLRFLSIDSHICSMLPSTPPCGGSPCIFH